MKKTNLLKKSLCILLLTIVLTACSNGRSGDSIIGTWVSEYSDIVVFEEDGSCSAPFTYNGSWCESASRYIIKDDDNTLVLSSKDGHAGGSYQKAETEKEALEDSGMYYVSKDTLIIDGDTYSFAAYQKDSILIGTWVSEYNDIVVFEEDGSCSAPFTYNGSWWESADRYAIKDDETLVLCSKDGHAGGSYQKAETEDEALEDSGMYYVSKKILIIDGDTYRKE